LVEAHAAYRLAFVQYRQQTLEDVQLGLGLLVTALGHPLDPLDGLFHGVHVGEGKLGVDYFDVGGGVNLVGDVDDVAVVKAAHHMGDGVGLANVGQELVAQAFTFRGAGDEAGNV